jgi:hypothetical protein
VSSIDGANGLSFSADQGSQCLAEAISAICDWKKVKGIVRPDFAPAASDSLGGSTGGQRAFELVWSD